MIGGGINNAVVDPVGNLASLTVALWVDSGSRHEVAAARGAAHVLEHLVTTTRSEDGNLSDLCDALGGRSEAITTPEFTMYAATLPRDHFAEGWRLLRDQFLRPDLSVTHLEAERSVVLDEIAGVRADHGRFIHEVALSNLLGDHPLGYPARGLPEDVVKLTAADVVAEHRRQLASRVVPIASGGVDSDEVREAFKTFSSSVPPDERVALQAGGVVRAPRMDDVHEKVLSPRSHVLVSWVLLDRSPADDFPLSVVNRLLGGATTGALQAAFAGQEGEYSCYTYRSVFSDCAVLSAYASCGSTAIDGTVRRIIRVIESAWSGVLSDPCSLDRAAQALNGSLAIGMESTRLRVNWIGRAMLDGTSQLQPIVGSVAPAATVVSPSAVDGLRARLRGPQVTVLEGVSGR